VLGGFWIKREKRAGKNLIKMAEIDNQKELCLPVVY